MQCFSSNQNRVDFPVFPVRADIDLARPEPLEPEFRSGDIVAALRRAWTPLELLGMRDGGSLKDTMPFLVKSGFQEMTQNWDAEKIEDMLSLIAEPQLGDPLIKVYEEARNLFMADQPRLSRIADCYRIGVMVDDG